jgi:hypothetical protein
LSNSSIEECHSVDKIDAYSDMQMEFVLPMKSASFSQQCYNGGMALILGLLAGVLGGVLVVLGGVGAYRDGFFFREQLFAQNIFSGLPYVQHYGMWSDLLLVTPVLSTVVTGYALTWSSVDILCAGSLGIVVSMWLHYEVYLRNPMQSFLGRGTKLTFSGWMHLIYTAFALSVFWLFYFDTVFIDHGFLAGVSAVVIGHLIICKLSKPVVSPCHEKQSTLGLHQTVVDWGLVLLLAAGIVWRTIGVYTAAA